MIKIILIFIFSFWLVNFSNRDQPDLDALEAKVKKLESQVKILLDAKKINDASKNERTKALYRILRDGDLYTKNELREAEIILRFIENNPNDESNIKKINILRKKFPRANQTGCALITWALSQEKETKEKILLEVIENHSDCYFSDGVSVGAYSRLYLALHYRSINKIEQSMLLVNEIKLSFPYAIDHDGRTLSEHLKELESILPFP